MTQPKPKRRRSRGNAWYWQQTDSWYFTPPGTKQRKPLRDDTGKRIRGPENKPAADLALARLKASRRWRPSPASASDSDQLVANVCSEFIQSCERRAASNAVSHDYKRDTVRFLNDLCQYCGALPVSQLKKGHIEHWIESHPTWKSPVTRRNAITAVLTAFKYGEEQHGFANPLKGFRKPPPRPRLHSITPEDERAMYAATDAYFADFISASVHTGLRPFCELAKLRIGDVEETPRGMMWRVYSTKTKKTRKIPVRHAVAERVRILIRNRSASEVVFRNSQGNLWKKPTGVHRFLAIKRKLRWDTDPIRSKYSCYSCRHTFAHRMLAGHWNGGVGCSIEVLAELMGDTPTTAFNHYGREWGQHYQEPLWAALGVPAQHRPRGSGSRVLNGSRPK